MPTGRSQCGPGLYAPRSTQGTSPGVDPCRDSRSNTTRSPGYNSSGRFYEKSTDMLGMTPTQFKTGGTNEEIRFALGQTSLGAILVASSKRGVASILLGNDPFALLRELQD